MLFKIIAILLLVLPGAFSDTAARLLPACPTEDSTDCYWDAATRGDGPGKGQGRSFVNIDGHVIYLDGGR